VKACEDGSVNSAAMGGSPFWKLGHPQVAPGPWRAPGCGSCVIATAVNDEGGREVLGLEVLAEEDSEGGTRAVRKPPRCDRARALLEVRPSPAGRVLWGIYVASIIALDAPGQLEHHQGLHEVEKWHPRGLCERIGVPSAALAHERHDLRFARNLPESGSPGPLPGRGPHQIRTRRFPPSGSSAERGSWTP
jgi:hypothetical protein